MLTPRVLSVLAIGLAAVATTGGGAQAAVIVTEEAVTSFSGLQADDTLQAMAGSIPITGPFNSNGSGGLRDATSSTTQGAAAIATNDNSDPGPFNWDFVFGVGDEGLGWTLSEIVVFSGIAGGQDGISRQSLEFGIAYSDVAAPTVFDNIIVANAAYNESPTGAGDGVRITVDFGSTDVTDLHTLRFVVQESPSGPQGPNNLDLQSAYAEIDVNAVSTIPEPASAALLAIGGSLLLARRRQALDS